MKLPALSPELSARLQERIADLHPTDPQGWSLGESLLRICQQELNALPLHANSVYLWALRPDGTLLCLDHEALTQPVEPETDPQRAYAAVVHGVAQYPELAEIVPWYRMVFLMSRGRLYHASEIPSEQLEEAIAEGRVLRVYGGARAFGSGDVWFTIASPVDTDAKDIPDDGTVYRKPLRPEDVPERDSYDSTWEYWRFHDEFELEMPYRNMTPHQRRRYRQVVAGLVNAILEFTPLVLLSCSLPYRELLRRYITASTDPDDPSTAAISQRLDECAKKTHMADLLFDPDRVAETTGNTAPVNSFVSKVHQTMEDHLRSDWVGEGMAGRYYIADSARFWYLRTVRFWMTEAAWVIQAGEEMPVPNFAADKELPQYLQAFGAHAAREPQSRLREQLDQLDPGDSASAALLACMSMRSLLIPKLFRETRLPGNGLADLLEVARSWNPTKESEIIAQAPDLADEAARLGGDPVYGVPFRLMTLHNPVEVASAIEEAARAITQLALRHWTTGLPDPYPVSINTAGDIAAATAREEMRRTIHRVILPRAAS